VRYLQGGKVDDDTRDHRDIVLVRDVDARHRLHGFRVSIVDDDLRGLFRLQSLEIRDHYPSTRVQSGQDSLGVHGL
jgi:hypothetical protein